MRTTDDLTIVLPDRRERLRLIALASTSSAVLAWLGVLAAASLTGGGVVLFLVGIPLVITAAAVWVSRLTPAWSGTERTDDGAVRPSRSLVVVPLGYAAVLAWVGLSFVALADPGAVVLLGLPFVLTALARVSRRRLKAEDVGSG